MDDSDIGPHEQRRGFSPGAVPQMASSMPPGMAFEVPPFGGTPSENVNRFIRACNMYVRQYEAYFEDEEDENDYRLRTVAHNLRDEARRWYDEDLTDEQRNECDTLVAALKDKFNQQTDADSIVKAVEAMNTLRQGELSMVKYVNAAKRIYTNLPDSVKPALQNIVIKGIKDNRVRHDVKLLVTAREIKPSFNTVCNLMLQATETDGEEERNKPTVRPSKEEEERVRLMKFAQGDTAAVMSSLVEAIKNMSSTQPAKTYPGPTVTRQPKPDTTPQPCYNCWETGHYGAQCPKGYNSLSLTDKRKAYAVYADKARKDGLEPIPMPAGMERRVTTNRPVERGREVPVAAYADDEDEFSSANCVEPYYHSENDDAQMSARHVRFVDETGTHSLAVDDDDCQRDDNKLWPSDAALAGDASKRKRGEVSEQSIDERPTTKAVRKTKRSARDKAESFRHTRMMENAPQFDIVKYWRDKKISVEDGVTWGWIFDRAPSVSTTFAKSLVRPTRRHKFDPQPPPMTPTGAVPITRSQTQRPADAVMTTQVTVKDPDMPKIANFFTTAVLSVRRSSEDVDSYQIPGTLLDAGSTMDFIHSDLVQALKLNYTPTPERRLKVANGYTVKVIGRFVGTLTMAERVTKPLIFYIMHGDVPYNIMVGIPGLHAFNITADFRERPQGYRVRKEIDGRAYRVVRTGISRPTVSATVYEGKARERSVKSLNAVLCDEAESTEQITSTDCSEDAEMDKANETVRQLSYSAFSSDYDSEDPVSTSDSNSSPEPCRSEDSEN